MTAQDYDVQAEARFQFLLAQKIRIGTQDLKIAAIALSQGAKLPVIGAIAPLITTEIKRLSSRINKFCKSACDHHNHLKKINLKILAIQ
ncbi:hypothetical protein [Planktothricoides raciborskii]|uniref:Uncharacterized protein n=1 Tax=Planktothricoides raciborskii GIHE-MW2 TaxID=2792601 RepID=A0AAU8JBY4_9CYAN